MDSHDERRQRLYRIAGVILKRRDMGEADRLLTVLARDRGKLTLLAKGVRRPASRKAGHIEPFRDGLHAVLFHQRFRQSFCPVQSPRGKEETGSLRCECPGAGFSDPGAGAGDADDLSLE